MTRPTRIAEARLDRLQITPRTVWIFLRVTSDDGLGRPRRDPDRVVGGMRVVEAPDAASALRLMGLLGTPRLALTEAEQR